MVNIEKLTALLDIKLSSAVLKWAVEQIIRYKNKISRCKTTEHPGFGSEYAQKTVEGLLDYEISLK